MNELQCWHSAVNEANGIRPALPDPVRSALDRLLHRSMCLKEELLELALAAGSAEICRTCCGQCCLYGKYHLTVMDLITYQQAGVAPPSPRFDCTPHCPYGDHDGCRLLPPFRPVTCVIFNCEAIEGRMDEADRRRFREMENELRDLVLQSERIAGRRIGRPALLSVEDRLAA